ncbi:hypothetical protein [Klebsiella phage Kpn74]|uniref:Uncharacterized protein n=1 Tax=Klebsiella phage Kpn74 TaxID=3044026 RepID=A0AAT9V524_9CAUD|nr:hypothetical protein [Klebsiella phage Kpn74]
MTAAHSSSTRDGAGVVSVGGVFSSPGRRKVPCFRK